MTITLSNLKKSTGKITFSFAALLLIVVTGCLHAQVIRPVQLSTMHETTSIDQQAHTNDLTTNATITPELTNDKPARYALKRPSNSRDPVTPAGYQQPGFQNRLKRPATQSDSTSKAGEIHSKLTQRYSNPELVRFLQNVSDNAAIQLYRETSQLIDTRHLQPTSYQSRVQNANANLLYALSNQAFMTANRIKASPAQINAFRTDLQTAMQTLQVRNASEAVTAMYHTISLANRHLRLRAAGVAVEYVYASADTLDKYSTFLPDSSASQPRADLGDLDDHVVGIGVEIKAEEEGARVLKAIWGTPAANGGVEKGDMIVTVNGVSLAGKTIDQIADLIAGPAGSRVLLGVRRGGRMISPITLVRRSVPLKSVSEVKMVDRNQGVGYIRLDRFAKKSSEEMDQALWNLYNSGMRTLILDLRGNPGGLLTTAIEISDKFLPNGTIVSTRGRLASDNSVETAALQKTWRVPLVVLIDGNSASASEIFAAAIQDNKRGLIVGQKSYGKGTVQTHFPLQTVAGNLKLTTAKFYAPSGREMAGQGVTPDVQVATALFQNDQNYSDAELALEDDTTLQKAIEVAGQAELKSMASKAYRK